MSEIRQEDPFGCGIACTAAVLDISYREAVALFQEGRREAEEIGVYCREIVEVLASAGLDYEYKHIGELPRDKIFNSGTIVFLRKSNRYPDGHYLCRVSHGNMWMDPWINFPNEDRKSGYRRQLPEEPEYVIYPVNPKSNLRS